MADASTCRHPGCQFRIIRAMTDTEYCYRHRPKPGAAPAAPEPPAAEGSGRELPLGLVDRPLSVLLASASMPMPPAAAQQQQVALEGELQALALEGDLTALALEGRGLFFRSISGGAAAEPAAAGYQRAASHEAPLTSMPDTHFPADVSSTSASSDSDSDFARAAAGARGRGPSVVDPRRALDILYEEVLGAVVPSAARRAQLIASESDARKEQLIEMYQQYVTQSTVQVEVHDAVGLAKADRFGQSDPFCRVQWRSSRYEPWQDMGSTQVRKRTLTPSWGETFSWSCPSKLTPRGAVRVQVFDYNRIGAPDFLGEATVSVRQAKRMDSGKAYHDLLPSEDGEDNRLVQGAVGLSLGVVRQE